jgi:delta 1-pyrroline-5-carboxylate dehydrogenase
MRVADEDEAVEFANATEYGLDASVWTADRAKARRIADRLAVGCVLINDHLINYAMPDVPFGGTRASGFGRIHGLDGIREFVRTKPIIEDRVRLAHEPHWFQEGARGLEFARAMLDLRHGRGLLHRLKAGWRLLLSLRP